MHIDDLFRGPPSKAKWEALGRYLKSQRIIGGVGVKIVRDAQHGVVISSPRTPPATTGTEQVLPLTLKTGTVVSKVQVIPGYVNSQMPTLSSVALDAETPPELTVTADVWVWLKCVGTFGTPDSYVVTIETSSTSAVPSGTAISSTGFTSFRCLGMVDYTSGSPATYEIINYHNGGNLGVDSFGNVNLWWLA